MFDVMALFDNATMFPPEAAEKLKAIFRPVDYRKHDYFIRCGDQPHLVALILNGYFRSFVLDENGNMIEQAIGNSKGEAAILAALQKPAAQ